MSYEFQDAAPVPVTGAGRKAEPNPFKDVIAAIALQTDKETGKPLAKKFVESHAAGERDKADARIRRLMSNAGAENDPQVTVRVDCKPAYKTVKGEQVEDDTKSIFTFWTIKRQERPRTASTDQSVAPAETPAA